MISWKGPIDSIANGEEDRVVQKHDVAKEIGKTSPLDTTNQILTKGKFLVIMFLLPYNILVKLRHTRRLAGYF